MPQTDLNDYGFTLPVAQAGQKRDLVSDVVDSFAAEGVVPFGRGVISGTNPEKQVLLPAGAGFFRGVALFTHAKEQLHAQPGTAEYKDKDTVSVLSRGRVYVEVLDTVAAGDDAFVEVAAGADQGKFLAASTGNLGPVGVFLTAAVAGELAVVALDGAVDAPIAA